AGGRARVVEGRRVVGRGRFLATVGRLGQEVRLPRPGPDGEELGAAIEEHGVAGRGSLTHQKGRDVVAVDGPVGGDLAAGELDPSDEEVHGRGHLVCRYAGR